MKYTIVIVCIVMLCACSGNRSYSPTRPYALDVTPPPGSPIFQQGYSDGCESALSGMGNQFVKVFHGFTYDTTQTKNKLYTRMWDASNNYCRLFLFVGDEYLQNEDFHGYEKPIWFWK